MNFKKALIFAPALIALTACTPTQGTPVVTSFNGDSVTIQAPIHTKDSAALMATTTAEAERICNKGDAGSRAEHVSVRQITRMDPVWGAVTDRNEHLFLCLK